MRGRHWIGMLTAVAVVVGAQLGVSAAGCTFYLTQAIMAAYYSVVVLGLCLVMGYAGQISLGHGAFFALGGYTSAILTTRHVPLSLETGAGHALASAGILGARADLYGGTVVTCSPWAAFCAALLITFAAALLIGYPALRLKGHYLAMATLGFGLIVYRLLLGSAFTGSADGITGVPPWTLAPGLTLCGRLTDRVANYYIAWGFTLAVLALLANLVDSRPGRALRAIHDSEVAANALGVDTARLKLAAFVISAVLAAAAGSLLTHFTGGIGPSESDAMKSVRYVSLVAAGGMGSLWGGLLVSAVLTFLSLRGSFGSFDHAVFGGLLIVIVTFAPEGPLDPIRRAWSRLPWPVRRRPAAAGGDA